MTNLQVELSLACIISQSSLCHFQNLVTNFFQLTVALTYSCMVKRNSQKSCIVVRLDNIYYFQLAAKFFTNFNSAIQRSPGAFAAINRNKNFFKHYEAPPQQILLDIF